MNQEYYSLNDIMNIERRKRGTMMNYLSGFKSANLIGTSSKEGIHNLAIFNSVVHIGGNPPYLGFILRPTTVERHTFQNIQETSYYTINAITKAIYPQAHQTSAKYDKTQSEFEAVGLTPTFKADFHAPFVHESPLQLGLQLEEIQQIKCNDTLLVIGKVQHLFLPKNSVGEDGHFNLSEHQIVSIGGLDTYYSTEKLEQLAYARVKA